MNEDRVYTKLLDFRACAALCLLCDVQSSKAKIFI